MKRTKKISGRRVVRYETFDDILQDAERLAVTPTRTLGNWSVGQIYKHLALATDVMIDGPPSSLPAPVQWAARLLLRKRMTTRTLPSGFQLTGKARRLVPDEVSTEEGLRLLKVATARVKATPLRGRNPVFGRCSREDWDAFHLRHCEMHMSFIVPVQKRS